jgi:TPR repeat protein
VGGRLPDVRQGFPAQLVHTKQSQLRVVLRAAAIGLRTAGPLLEGRALVAGIALHSAALLSLQLLRPHCCCEGDALALRRLGYRRLTGQGLPRDVTTAVADFEAAAGLGDAQSLFNLGYCHLRGLGVPADASLARTYFEQAANQGLAAGYNGLGILYYQVKPG